MVVGAGAKPFIAYAILCTEGAPENITREAFTESA